MRGNWAACGARGGSCGCGVNCSANVATVVQQRAFVPQATVDRDRSAPTGVTIRSMTDFVVSRSANLEQSSCPPNHGHAVVKEASSVEVGADDAATGVDSLAAVEVRNGIKMSW